MASGFSEWLASNMLPCWMKSLTGFDCPGCGIQRSFLALINGDLYQSILLFPALIPVILMFLFLLLHLLFDFRNGASLLKWSYIFNTILIIGYYLFRLPELLNH